MDFTLYTAVDHTKDDLPVFESGAILLYLADQDPQEQLLPKAVPERAKVLSWLFLQMAALGPMQGQLNAFLRYLPGENKVATERFISETERLYTVLEKQLENRLWLAADRFTVADIAFFPWVYMHDYCGKNYSYTMHAQG
ncbi:probable protein URE2 [Coccomyxa sp. Obi]|nr:probable protein URE2 [Coccomyxa sp. Obi]BDA45227.1 probable protein URE2 [Coccomyxa sp. Obi]